MGYKSNNQYIIENDVEKTDNVVFQKEIKTSDRIANDGLPDGYEIEEDTSISPAQSVQQELLEEAAKEGLVSSEEYLGGKGATPEEVIEAMKSEGMTEGAQEKKKEYEEQKLNDFKTVTATRDLLLNRVQRTISIFVPMLVPVQDVNTGEIKEEPRNIEFKVKRLTEAENTHILNHKLIGKEISEMTDEEYVQSSQFRSKVLEKAIVEPKMTAAEWQNCSNGDITAIYDKVNKVLTEADDVSTFQ